MTSKLKRAVGQTLPVIALAFLMAEPPRAAQADSGLEQMQTVLAGRPGGHSARAASERAIPVTADVQELARRSVLGAASSGVSATSIRPDPEARPRVSEQSRAALLARGDAQALARHAVLGPHHLSPRGS